MKQANATKLGSIWTAKAKIQIIGIDNKWKTIAECMDTPNAIKGAAQKLQNKGWYCVNQMWVVGGVTDRKMVNDL